MLYYNFMLTSFCAASASGAAVTWVCSALLGVVLDCSMNLGFSSKTLYPTHSLALLAVGKLERPTA